MLVFYDIYISHRKHEPMVIASKALTVRLTVCATGGILCLTTASLAAGLP